VATVPVASVSLVCALYHTLNATVFTELFFMTALPWGRVDSARTKNSMHSPKVAMSKKMH